MTYRVFLQPEAESGIHQSYDWLAEQSPTAADDWLSRIEQACNSLSELPERCPLAPESDFFDVPIRQLICCNHRILFTIDKSVVHVLHVRHAARSMLGEHVDRRE
ncbi:hypothetical protein B7486_12560 [cyanobacterium TDX16]|nr:hypothetical protein B7486_12560 [cyanobacterium TDX16]